MNPLQVVPTLGSAELTIASSDYQTPLKSDEPFILDGETRGEGAFFGPLLR